LEEKVGQLHRKVVRIGHKWQCMVKAWRLTILIQFCDMFLHLPAKSEAFQ